MKLRITVKDLEGLDESQKAHLSDLWLPEKYDLAAALICTDAVEEKYEFSEFVVGAIQLEKHGGMTLHDITSLPRPGENIEDEESLRGPEIPDVSHGTGPFSSLNPLTGAYNGLISPLGEAAENAFAEEDYTNEDASGEFDTDLEEYFSCFMPTSFNKETCLPLLNMSQMLEILQRNGFSRINLYFTAFAGEKTFTIGKDPANWEGFDMSFEETEPCDVLWEAVKALL